MANNLTGARRLGRSALTLWLVFCLGACGERRGGELPAKPDDGDDLFALLARNGVRRLREGEVGGRVRLGDVVGVPGFAVNTPCGPAVTRQRELATCDALPAWPRSVVGDWVFATGTLVVGDPPELAEKRPLWQGCAPFALSGCAYRVGATMADVAPSDLDDLTPPLEAGPVLGQRLSIIGTLGFVYETAEVQVGKVNLRVRCVSGVDAAYDGRVVRIDGTLGYLPRVFLEGAPPTELARPNTPPEGRWLINGCPVVPEAGSQGP